MRYFSHAQTLENRRYLPRRGLASLIQAFVNKGYQCVGPVVKEGVIDYQAIRDASQLAGACQDQQAPGRYQLVPSESPRIFNWANGPQAAKRWLFPPVETLWQAQRSPQGLQFQQVEADITPTPTVAFGLRPCDIAAIRLQDQHFLERGQVDSHYQARRHNLILVAVNCYAPSDTCFCARTGDGPVLEQGADLILDELDDGFVIRIGSEQGQACMDGLDTQAVTDAHDASIESQTEKARYQMLAKPALPDFRNALRQTLESDAWQSVADRCLGCGNCTMVCPSCFCNQHQEQPALDDTAQMQRQWDSCFNPDHSYIHGIRIKGENKQRYQQWLVHKLDTWHDQYGRSGCVGCGRCITWCPVGIDLIAEARSIMESR